MYESYYSLNKAEDIFVINPHLKLGLVEGETRIFVNGEYYFNCASLFFNLSRDLFEEYKDISSIDEAAKYMSRFHHQSEVTPLEEFRGHCSNLQAWYEHGYDIFVFYNTKIDILTSENFIFKLFKHFSIFFFDF